MMDAGEIAILKVGNLLNKFLIHCKTPKAKKNTTVILMHKKGDSDLKNYRPINLLPIVYKLLTKVIRTRISGTRDSNQPREPQTSAKDSQ